MILTWLLVVDQWLEAVTEVLCAAFWTIAGALAVLWLLRFFMGRR